MATQFFSDKNRALHLGPYPMERLSRVKQADYPNSPTLKSIDFRRQETPQSIVNAMGEYQAMLDAIRDGLVNKAKAQCPSDPQTRADHLKAFGYFSDASAVGACLIPPQAHLETPFRNPDVDQLAEDLRTKQTTTLAAGIDLIMADLKESMDAPPTTIKNHTHALVFIYEYPRDPNDSEPGTGWINNAQPHRACLRSAETAVVIANYIRLLGYDARAHTGTTSEVDLNVMAIAAGLATVEEGVLTNPYLGDRFGIAVVTTEFEIAIDKPLASWGDQPKSKTHGLAWKLGKGSTKSASNREMFAKRRYVDGAHPFEKLKRVETPTTYIDEPRVARVPKRTDMFARSQFGDMGKANQDAAKGGYYVRKAAPSMAQRRALGAFVLIQSGEPEPKKCEPNPKEHADLIKATLYFLGADAVGISRCPKWTWYSHNAIGEEIVPTHDQAISMIIDQGYETTDGSSGDDWIAVAQSMRAYLRFSLLGGVIAKQIRNLGYEAKAHTVMDGDVLQPPLLLLSGLGEVSRIGEVILNPYLGPRLKSGVVTTNLPLAHDKPIDFGLQKFCESCNKCARECPSGAITAGPKLMFNGYEIWKSDSQKCTTYRITNKGGAMCGRCMKTCPWNLEGLFAEKPFRWAAINIPRAAPVLAKLDDVLGNGGLNPVKNWWWDLEVEEDGGYRPTKHTANKRDLDKDLNLEFKNQTLAVYPANLAPHPWPFPFPMDREKGIEAYQAMVTAKLYKAKISAGKANEVVHEYKIEGDAPVIRVEITKSEKLSAGVTKYEFSALDGKPLPKWSAGAHLDIVVAPEFLRQYSMSGDPADRSKYQIGVLREDEGRGGSQLLHRIFTKGRKIFISKPINHFPLDLQASKSYFMGGGIGITPMIAMAHEAFAADHDFEMHYSIHSRAGAGYLKDLAKMPWYKSVFIHVSDESKRADLQKILKPAGKGKHKGAHVYTCGPDNYMQSVMEAAEACGVVEGNRHLEYFSVPELPEYENHDFTLKLKKSGKEFLVPANKNATEVLLENGFHVDVKCSDGICGVCKCGLISGDVEHRDFVLSNKQRETAIILCQSRAKEAGGVLEVDI